MKRGWISCASSWNIKTYCVVDIGEGVHVFINPEILEESGSCIDVEGCLSLPGRQGKLKDLIR